MGTNVATSIEQAKASLNARRTEAEAATLRYEELTAERKAVQERLNDAFTAAELAASAEHAAERAEYQAELILAYAESNAVAEAHDSAMTRQELIDAVEGAVGLSMPYASDEYSYGECIVNMLERAQCNGGFYDDEHVLTELACRVVRKNGNEARRKLTERERERAMDALKPYCPRHENGKLCTPYVLNINEDGRIVR